jgi:hypothetical protein
MSFCYNCGSELTEGTAFCPNCGTAQVQQTHAPEPQVIVAAPVVQQNPNVSNTLTGPAKILSLISMICGLVSLGSTLYGFIPGIAALILSGLAYKKAPGVPNTKAKVGRITGIFGIIISVLCWIAYILYFVLLGVGLAMSLDSGYYY